eukprot:tig00020675_g12605.t1
MSRFSTHLLLSSKAFCPPSFAPSLSVSHLERPVEKQTVRQQKEELELRLRAKEAADKRRVVSAVKEASVELSNLKTQVTEITKVLKTLLAAEANGPQEGANGPAALAATHRSAGRRAGAGAGAGAGGGGGGAGNADREATVARLVGEVNGLLAKIAARRGGGSPLGRIFADARSGLAPPEAPPGGGGGGESDWQRPATGSSGEPDGYAYDGNVSPGGAAGYPHGHGHGQGHGVPSTSRSVNFPPLAAPAPAPVPAQGVYTAPLSAPVAQSWVPLGAGSRAPAAYPPQPRGPPPRVAHR